MREGRASAGLIAGALLGALGGCPATVGRDCDAEDLALAREVVYAPDGSPAYAGQALVVASCGGTAFCHTQTAGAQRFGAPADLVFDPLVVDGVDEAAEQRRLREAVLSLYRHRDDVYTSVVNGTMPPSGGPAPDLREAATSYRRYASATDAVGTPLPAVQTAEGREILRNWLACGAPVVERAEPSPIAAPCGSDEDCPLSNRCEVERGECAPIGDVVGCRLGEGLTPTWSSIHEHVVGPACALAGCHGAGSSVLDLSDEAAAYATLTSGEPIACDMDGYVVPGDAPGSYLAQKLLGTAPCGDRMPPAGLCAPVRDVILAWIDAGAPP
jgi:hypothetical protein